MITIIDYGLGNIFAFVNIYKRLGIQVRVARNEEELTGSTKLILPGVGAFDYAMERLDLSGMRHVLDEMVLGGKVPVMGICVGMQIMVATSDEGEKLGLGWISGRVRGFKLVSEFNGLPLPHMGWNNVYPIENNRLFKGLSNDSRFYFLHSYFLECGQKDQAIAVSDYGINFCCAVQSGNVFGIQFHPEKSHHWGIQLLENFAKY